MSRSGFVLKSTDSSKIGISDSVMVGIQMFLFLLILAKNILPYTENKEI